jgi:gamma-glutamyl phosphate reductase
MRFAQRQLAAAPAATRTAVLERVAGFLVDREAALRTANDEDLAVNGLEPALRGRLVLANKLPILVDGLRQLAAMSDPIDRPLKRTQIDEGLELTQVQSPIGVLLVIFESRPDAVIQIGGLALRSGNAVLLKGGTEATQSNRALVQILRDALAAEGLSPDAVVGVEGRAAVAALLTEEDRIDLVIPRGSRELVKAIRAATRIPVIGHAEGVCMTYLDAAADPVKALRIVVDGKTSYPEACNATETLLVHRDWLSNFGPVADALTNLGVEIRADETALPVTRGALPAQPTDGAVEYGALVIAVRVVEDLDAAIGFVNRHSSHHTDAIVTEDPSASARFLREVDSASVFVNVSTRFADGYRYGLGAEVGISTSRIHARGPVGIDGLMSTRWLLTGDGQITTDYGPNGRALLHRTRPIG